MNTIKNTRSKSIKAKCPTDTRTLDVKKRFPFRGKIPEITVSDRNNWDVGKYHVQTYPKALLITGKVSKTILQAYKESLRAYSLLNLHRIDTTPTGEFKFNTDSKNLYSRNEERLFLLGFESLLKGFVMDGVDVLNALEHIRLGRERPKKELPWEKKNVDG